MKLTSISPLPARGTALSRLLASPQLATILYLGLCAAYIQGPLTKILDFPDAVAEMTHFGLQPPGVFAVLVIVFELLCSAMIVSGRFRTLGALCLSAFTLLATLIALRFWNLPPGMERTMAANAFFEHIGLAAAFLIVATKNLAEKARAAI